MDCLIHHMLQSSAARLPDGLLFPQQVAHIARDCRMRGLITTREKLISLSSVLAEVPSLDFVMVAAFERVCDSGADFCQLSEGFGSKTANCSP